MSMATALPAPNVPQRYSSTRPWKQVADTVVERAIAIVGGSPSRLGQLIGQHAGLKIIRQNVHGWRLRGVFPKHLCVAAHEVTGIPLPELVLAQPRAKDKESNPVRAVLAKLEFRPAQLAAEITRKTGRKITRQMVNNWEAAGQFPRAVVLDVHMIAGLPVAFLLGTGKP